jgi:hypothetical protein
MKILRVRRGFTTNSSASSEWIPGQSTPPPGIEGGGPSGASQPSSSTTAGSGGTRPSVGSSADTAKVGGLIALVALAFTVQRVARSVWKRKKGVEPTDE